MFAEAVLVATEMERRAMLRKHYTEHDPELDEAFKQKEVQTRHAQKENSVNKGKGKKRNLCLNFPQKFKSLYSNESNKLCSY